MRKGFGEWIEENTPDVLLLQEVRADIPTTEKLVPEGYNAIVHPCEIKGRAGVAVLVRKGIEIGDVRYGAAEESSAVDTGRWLEVSLPEYNLRAISAYLHSGDAASEEKMAAKYSHLRDVSARLTELQGEENVLIAGDFNIVHTEGDIKNWKPNHNKRAGVLDEEIAYLDSWLEHYTDVQRQLTGPGQAEYTWWSQRGKAFDNNVGWRIDYQLASPHLAEQARSYAIGRAQSYDTRFSDHAPLSVVYEF